MSPHPNQELVFITTGNPGTGKTTMTLNVGARLVGKLQPTTDPSEEMRKQDEETGNHRQTIPTEPTGDKSIEELAGREVKWSERVGVDGVPAYRLTLVALSGEEVTHLIRSGKYKSYTDLAKEFGTRGSVTRVLGVVQNAFLSFPVPGSEERGTPVGRRPFLALVAYLCKLYRNHPAGPTVEVPAPEFGTVSLFRTAVETAGLGAGLAPPESAGGSSKKARRKRGEKQTKEAGERVGGTATAKRTVHTVDQAIGSGFQNLPADAYLRYHHGPNGGRFEVVANDLTEAQKQAVLQNLGRVADALTERYRGQFAQHQGVGERAPLIVVVRAWVDLVNLLADEGYLDTGPIRDANARALGSLADRPTVDADHYSVSFASDWRAVAAGRQPAFWPNPTGMEAKRDKAFDKLIEQFDRIMRAAPTSPPPPARPAVTSQDSRRGDVFAEGLYVIAQTAAVTFAVVAGLAVLLGWPWEVFGRWLLAAAAVSTARGFWHFVGTGRPANPAWKITDGRITVLDTNGAPVYVPDASIVCATPLTGLFDCGFVSANGRPLLVPQFCRFTAEVGSTVRNTPFAVVGSLACFAGLLMSFVVIVLRARA